MNKQRWRGSILGLLLVALAAWGACHLLSGPSSSEGELIHDRLWVTDFPEAETDYAHDFFVTSGGEYGSFARYSMFRYEEEIFEYDREGETLRLFFPQSDRRVTVGYSITSCDDLPPYDLCIDLDENPWHGPRRYYSFRGDDEPDPERTRLQRRNQRTHRR